MSLPSIPPSVVVHVHGSSWPQAATDGARGASRDMSGVLPADFPHGPHRAALSRGAGELPAAGARKLDDPFEVQKAMPEKWQAFVRDNFSDPRAVMDAFGVSERAARKWWNGEGGVNGAYLFYALRRWPEAVRAWLEAA
ncbi:hypothetical protein [Roseovarius pacificus]|uniref:hypothetical protein n=1 Tax=Roseovarius pacificus TaxID=337701 RepID=UPI0037487E71